MRGGGLDGIQVAPEALETWTELTHFPTPEKAARWGVSGTGWRLVLSLGVRSAARALRSRHLGILPQRLPGMCSRPGSPRLAQGARLTRLPHPPEPAANGSSSPALGSRGRRGLGRMKQGEGRKLAVAEGPDSRAPRRPGGRLWGRRLQLPERKRIPRALLQERNTPQLPPARAPPAGTEARRHFPGLPTPCRRCAHSRGPAGVQPQFASRSRRGAGPPDTAEAAADAPLPFPPGDLGEGRGGDAAEPGALLSLSPPALQRSASDCIYFAGHEAWGPVLGRFLLHLQRQCLLAPCAAQSRSLGRRRRPMQQQRAGAGGAGRAGPRSLRARPLGQSPRQDRCRGGSRPRARAARSQSARRSPRRARERRARKSGPRALVCRVDPLCVRLLEGKR